VQVGTPRRERRARFIAHQPRAAGEMPGKFTRRSDGHGFCP